MKKDKAINATAKTARLEANTVSTAPRVKPDLALPVMYFQEPLHFFLIIFHIQLWAEILYIYIQCVCLCVCVCVGVGNRIMNIYEVSLTILSHFNLGSWFFFFKKKNKRVLIFYRMRQTHNNPPIIIQLFKELQSRMLISSVIISFMKLYPRITLVHYFMNWLFQANWGGAIYIRRLEKSCTFE